jgi:hypothetical protein
MRRAVVSLCVLVAFCAVSNPAWAAGILWTLQGVQFDDGGTASGSFVYDPQTNTFSDVNITTTAGTTRGGDVYGFIHPVFSDSLFAFFLTQDISSDQTGLPAFGFSPFEGFQSLSPQAILGGAEEDCVNAACDLAFPNLRLITAGTLVPTAAIPTLSTWGTLAFVVSLVELGFWQLSRARRSRSGPRAAAA